MRGQAAEQPRCRDPGLPVWPGSACRALFPGGPRAIGPRPLRYSTNGIILRVHFRHTGRAQNTNVMTCAREPTRGSGRLTALPDDDTRPWCRVGALPTALDPRIPMQVPRLSSYTGSASALLTARCRGLPHAWPEGTRARPRLSCCLPLSSAPHFVLLLLPPWLPSRCFCSRPWAKSAPPPTPPAAATRARSAAPLDCLSPQPSLLASVLDRQPSLGLLVPRACAISLCPRLLPPQTERPVSPMELRLAPPPQR